MRLQRLGRMQVDRNTRPTRCCISQLWERCVARSRFRRRLRNLTSCMLDGLYGKRHRCLCGSPMPTSNRKISQRRLRHDIGPLHSLLILPMPWRNHKDRHVLALGIRQRDKSWFVLPSDICTARCKTAVTMAWWMNTWTHMFLYRIANTAISCGRRLVRLQKFAHQACSTIVRSAYQVQRNTPVPPNLQKQQQLMAKHSLSPTRAPVKVCTSLPRTVKAESTTSAVSSFVKEKAQPRHLPAALFGHESSSNAEKT